jgi:hypothetical protein
VLPLLPDGGSGTETHWKKLKQNKLTELVF